MTPDVPQMTLVSPEAQSHAQRIVESALSIRIPALFQAPRGDALYFQPDRNGIATTVLRTTDLSEDELVLLMRYRLAQYLSVSFVDANMIYDQGLTVEPLTGVYPDDIHIVAGSAEGEILCYAVIKSPPGAAPGVTLRDENRPLFPAEHVHGWGIFNRLRVLPDLPVAKIREMGRFVKNQTLGTLDERGARAPVEVGVAIFRTLSGSLRLEVEAIVGDLEEGVAKQNLDFFHVPMAVIHGTVPFEAEASYFYPRYQFSVVYPFALLSADISRHMIERLDAIEAALEQPGKAGLLALFKLKREAHDEQSALLPPGGLAALTDADMPQHGVSMANRRELLDVAAKLRETDLFHGLSVAEASVLGSFMERESAEPGTVILRQGEPGDDMYLIEAGTVDVQIGREQGRVVSVATLGPGDFFGEIGLLTGAERMADVVAAAPVSLLRLSRDAYTRYLTHAAEVDHQITRAAMTRTRETTRAMLAGAGNTDPSPSDQR